MTRLLDRALSWLHATAARDSLVANEAAMGNIRRLRWLGPVFLALVLALLAVFALGPEPGSASQLAWKQSVVTVYIGAAVWLVVLVLAAWSLAARARPSPAVAVLQFVAPLSMTVFTIALAVIDQAITPNISPYLLGCLTVSLLFLLPPVTAMGLFVLSYALFFTGLGLTQHDPILLLTNRANGFAASLLGLLLSLVLWRQNVGYTLLQRELRDRNATLEKQQSELVWLATRDPLTGLYNRREFMRLAEGELMRTQRHGGYTGAILLDLDNFKWINDRHGHPAGDAVLVHVASCLLGGVRGTDIVARIGGEEFMVLLPQTDIDAAAGLAQKLLRLLRESTARVGGDLQIPVTASFGVSCMPGGKNGSVAALYAAADKALYEAKRKGRNRVERTEPDGSLTPSDFQRMRRH